VGAFFVLIKQFFVLQVRVVFGVVTLISIQNTEREDE